MPRDTSVAQSGSIVSGVAGRYASALFELAREANAVDKVGQDLARFEALVAGSEDLARLVKSPVFTSEEQVAALSAVLDRAGIGGLTGNFLRLVAQKKRLFVVSSMIRGYRDLVAKAAGIVRAEVTLAEAPSAQRLNDIKAALRETAGGEIDLAVKIDPAIIGGLIVKLGSRMIDASLRTKLNSIRLAMKEVG